MHTRACKYSEAAQGTPTMFPVPMWLAPSEVEHTKANDSGASAGGFVEEHGTQQVELPDDDVLARGSESGTQITLRFSTLATAGFARKALV
ncbi:hypothetical protein NUW58_g7579 [Xylaria curta]|uniref:Uncharacterized protein n=1 Tax=Xylaria curta TaxID=42375 RepID=A0ACC1NFV5_9PEZI|nr:hypothetical protein NUW58_g7579 [Xylaria curta]